MDLLLAPRSGPTVQREETGDQDLRPLGLRPNQTPYDIGVTLCVLLDKQDERRSDTGYMR